MPYLTAVAHTPDAHTYTVTISIAPSWRKPVALFPFAYDTTELATDVPSDDHEPGDPDLHALLTRAVESHGYEVRRGWVATRFGIQAHVKRASKAQLVEQGRAETDPH